MERGEGFEECWTTKPGGDVGHHRLELPALAGPHKGWAGWIRKPASPDPRLLYRPSKPVLSPMHLFQPAEQHNYYYGIMPFPSLAPLLIS